MDIANSLHSSQKLALLNDIDKLRSQGVSQFVGLPQLIVCGDQSSGKSSVLEGISGIPFPTKDNLCTRFATEVILRHSVESSINVSISPDPEKTAEEQASIAAFQHTLSSFEGFPNLVDSAQECMKKVTGPRAFYKDTLQLKVSGPNQPHLTIVDLPGLIHSDNKKQSMADVDTVKSMVSGYMRQQRCIILAVVSAKNDIANQVVLRLARELDIEGTRTIGIITKPDELREGSSSEADFIELARNNNVEFRLGWHVLRNRDYKEQDDSKDVRDEKERDFFKRGRWRDLSRDTVGIEALVPKLSDILFQQIKLQLPNLISDIQNLITSCESTLLSLGESRTTPEDRRLFLLNKSQMFQSIVRAALDGAYELPFFEGFEAPETETKRLRAVVQNANLRFAEVMRREGHDRRILEDDHHSGQIPTLCVKRSDLISEVRDLVRINRGRELPGMYNPLIVGKLFHRQSQPWQKLAEDHADLVWRSTTAFLESVIDYISNRPISEALLSQVIDPRMEERRGLMMKKLAEILAPYKSGHPITYNHYFTETVQSIRWKRREHEIDTALEARSENDKAAIVRISKMRAYKKVIAKTEVDMEKYACMEILDCMQAFYKVALKSVVDNVAIYAIEQCLVAGLDDLFSLSSVMGLSDELVSNIAAEPLQDARLREQTQRKLHILREGLATVRAHASRNSREVITTDEVNSSSRHSKTSSTANNVLYESSRNSSPNLTAAGFDFDEVEILGASDPEFKIEDQSVERRALSTEEIDEPKAIEKMAGPYFFSAPPRATPLKTSKVKDTKKKSKPKLESSE